MNKSLWMGIGLGLVTGMFVVQYSFANTYYVSTTGNDATGAGTSASPWRTLKYAATRVAASQGHTIQVGAGTFVENGLVEIPLGVSVTGAGIDVTIFKAVSTFYYHPADPGYGTNKFLISLSGFNPANGNQTLSNFSVDGDSKQLHGGIYVRYRNNVVIDRVKVSNTNFTGIWLWDTQDSQLTNTQLVNCSWGSSGWCSGALNLGNLQRVEISQLNVDENTGYGVKAVGPDGYNDIFNLKFHDSHISVAPVGLWNGGSAPNIAIELWNSTLVGCELYNNYVDNTISLVSSAGVATGVQTIRVHDNFLDMDTRAHGAGYGLELTIHDAEVDHNYFFKGNYGIANWDNPQQNWKIHHNTFYALSSIYPGEMVRSQWSGLHQVKFYNNTVEFTGANTMNVMGVYGGSSNDLELKNNLIINSNTGYNYYPNQLLHTEPSATVSNLTVLNNSTTNLNPGTVITSLLGLLNPLINLNILPNPSVTHGGNRPAPYYVPASGSSLINAGLNVGYPFTGSAPDIGAYESDAASNAPPQVSITSPANNANVAAGTTVTINASATDSDGSISKVEFFQGATKLGEDLTGPYSFTWANAPAGSYSLTAKATDNQSAVTSSAAVAIVVTATNAAPVVSITSPVNNSVFASGATVTINATATDSDGSVSKVEFFQGATKLGEDLTSPYSFAWTSVPTGSYSLTARATDNQSGVTNSSAVAIALSAANASPVVSITSPVNNSSVAVGATVTLNVTATDSDGSISKVEFFQGTTKLGEDLTSPYTFAWTSVPAGSYSLTAKATDNLSAATTSSPIVVTAVTAGNSAPVVTIIGPVNNVTYKPGTNVRITATATDADGTIAKVEFFQGTTKLGQDLTAPYTFTWMSVSPIGIYSLTAKATDNQGAATTSAPVSMRVDMVPVTSITSPLNNATFSAGSTVTITANATDSDGTITKVEFYRGAVKLGEDLTSPYSFAWVSALAGTHSLTARATDDLGARTISSAISISSTSSNTPPVVSITSPTANSTFTAGSVLTINATATDSDGSVAKVEFFQGAAKLGEDLTSPYSFAWASILTGTYTLTARGTDNQGTVSTSAAVVVIVNAANSAPSVSVTSPMSNSSFTSQGSIVISASATDSDGSIAKVEFFQGSSKLGESSISPYNVTWASVPTGNYSLTARATDNTGAFTVSTSVPIVVSDPATRFQLGLYAPDAVLSGLMTLTTDPTASKGSYFSVPAGNGPNYYIPPTSAATFNFQLPKTDTYFIWARVKSPSLDNQGYYIYDGNGNWVPWDAGVHTAWTWVKVTNASTGVIASFSLRQGTNELQMGWAHDLVSIDQLVVTNDPTLVPEEPVIVNQLTVFPNPVVDTFTIQYTSSVAQQAQVRIYDLMGTPISQALVSVVPGTNNVVLGTQGINNGTYIVMFQPTITGDQGTTRIVISR